MPGDAGAARSVHTPLTTARTAEDGAPPPHAILWSTWARQQAQLVTFVGADLLAFVMATGLAYLVSSGRPTPLWDWTISELLDNRPPGHIVCLALILALLIGYFARRGHYTERVPFWLELRSVSGAVLIALICDDVLLKTAIYHIDYTQELTVRWMSFIPLLLLWRSAGRRVLDRLGLWQLNTLIVAAPAVAQRIAEALTSESTLGYHVAGVIDPTDHTIRTLTAADMDRTVAAQIWARLLRTHQANFVAIGGGGRDTVADARLSHVAQRVGVPFALVPPIGLPPAFSKRPQYFLSHDVTMLAFHNNLSRPVARVLKRGFDVLTASLLLFLGAPLMLAIALLVMRDGGPALYRHRRIGAGGRSFPCIKFRTMHVNADAMLKDILARDPAAAAEWAATQKLRDDPRITGIGQVLRRTSLDELPQLLNVMRGEMSLVGPRPIVTAEVAFYGPQIADYCEARPGITGLWQVSGRSDTSYLRRVQLDVWYVRNWTLWHDLAILLKTVPAVLQRRGAV
ncbi:MAG TPA: undecaprenyl-phosphate galactose phosphotransferase WbaP [Acetobacteraceae bacterium]|nr:undecaprenyl-phosphate galactose phosphotransferase WbaP [Acetobacteraceae bacterium]